MFMFLQIHCKHTKVFCVRAITYLTTGWSHFSNGRTLLPCLEEQAEDHKTKKKMYLMYKSSG